MKKITIPVFIFYIQICFGQIDTLSPKNLVYDNDPRVYDAYVLTYIPCLAKNINGIALGLVGSETICNKAFQQTSNGINIQIFGQGIFLPIMLPRTFSKKNPIYEKGDTTNYANLEFEEIPNDTVPLKVLQNGLIISSFGTFTSKVNGISISACSSIHQQFNGLSINLIWNVINNLNGVSVGLLNDIEIGKGVQIGIINRSSNFKGIQIGLWNKNRKRSLLFINWDLKK